MQHKIDFLCLDYQGHGESDGVFEHLKLTDWLEDCLDVSAQTDKPLILVGSSMGGWLALRLTEILTEKIQGLVLLAPAPDFTERLMEEFTEEQVQDLQEKGLVSIDSGYEQPHVFTQTLIEDGKEHLILTRELEVACPVSIIQGKQDTSVPWQEAVTLVQKLKAPEIDLSLVDSADHGLSRPEDLERLGGRVLQLNSSLKI